MVSKKLLFSAMAVLAFNGVAIANSAEVKGLTTLDNEFKIALVQEKATPCEDDAIDFYEVVVGDGEDDLTLLNELIGACH